MSSWRIFDTLGNKNHTDMLREIIETVSSFALGGFGGARRRTEKEKKKDLFALCVFGVVIASVLAVALWITG
jgi:hypothetical protein